MMIVIYYQQHHISASTKSISVFEPKSNNIREWSRLKSWKCFFWKNWQKCIYYYFSDFVREERCWCADCQWRYAAAGLSPNLMLWLWADVFREIDWNRGKDSVQVRAKLFRENNAVILASIVYHVLFISQFQWKKFAILFVRNKIEILTQNSFLRHSIHVYFLHHRRMHHGQNSPASLIDP